MLVVFPDRFQKFNLQNTVPNSGQYPKNEIISNEIISNAENIPSHRILVNSTFEGAFFGCYKSAIHHFGTFEQSIALLKTGLCGKTKV